MAVGIDGRCAPRATPLRVVWAIPDAFAKAFTEPPQTRSMYSESLMPEQGLAGLRSIGKRVPAYRAFLLEMTADVDASKLADLSDERWLRLTVRTQYALDLRNARRLVELMEEAKRFGIAEAAIQHLASFLDSVRTVARQERSEALEEALGQKTTDATKSLGSA